MIRFLKKVTTLLLYTAVVLLGVAFTKKNELPRKHEILKCIQREPRQNKVNIAPFTVNKEGKNYTISPLYS